MAIEVAVVYTLDEAYRRIDRGEIQVEGATVLVDNLTNDVRGTRSRPAVTPQQLVRLVDGLRNKVMAAGAAAVVVCQLKPMEIANNPGRIPQEGERARAMRVWMSDSDQTELFERRWPSY